MEETEESSENFEIVKRKIAVVDKLLRNKEKLEQAKSDLTTENLLKDGLIADLKVSHNIIHYIYSLKYENLLLNNCIALN